MKDEILSNELKGLEAITGIDYMDDDLEIVDDGPRLLKVKGSNASKDSIVRLSRAIMISLQQYSYADLQSIAPPANTKMLKGYIKAKSTFQDYVNGYGLVMQASYKKVDIDDQLTTAIRSRVFAVPNAYIVGDSEDEPRLLKVKGVNASKDSVVRLARAIMVSLQQHNYADLQSIAPPANTRMLKGFIKAKSMFQDYANGYGLVMQASYKKVEIDGQLTTAIRSRVFAVPNVYIR
jgi:stage V sporulation protein SpoVS